MSVNGFDEVEKALQEVSELDTRQAVGEAIQFVRSAAVENCHADTGELRQSIFAETTEEENSVTGICWTDKAYAPYIEFGTGPKGQEKHAGISPEVTPVYTQQSWWIHESQIDRRVAEKYRWPYMDTPDGRFYRCSGNPAYPFLYPAMKDNEEQILKMLGGSLASDLEDMESKALQPVRNTLNKIREMLSRNPVKNFQIKAGIKVPTEEYAELQKNLSKAQQSLEKLQEKQHKFENTGKSKENQQWKSLVVDITRAEKKLSEYKDAAAKMETSGTAFKQTPTDEYREIRNSVKSLNEEIEKYEKKGEKLEAMGVKKESKQWRSLIYDIEQARGKLFEYEEKMKSLEKSGKSTQQVPTEEYQKIQKDILKVNKELDAYREKKNKLQALGVSKESQEWKSLTYDIDQAKIAVEEYKTKARQMESSNTDVKRPVSLPKQALNFGTGIFKGIGTTVSKGWGGFTKLLGGVGNVASSFTGVIRKCSGAYAALIQKFTSGIPFLNRTKSSFNGLGTSGRGLTGILKTIGMTAKFMFASFVIRGAVDGAKQGFQNLAQYSGETNRSLSLLMSSLTQLKNSLATAFAPILNVVAPILNSFIQTVIKVVNSIGQLMGALTGKTTMVTAKKVNQDYAASLNSTSTGLKNNAKNADTALKAAKQYQRTLLGFDQINKLNDDSDSSGSGGTGSGTDTSPLGGVNDMFQTTAIKSRFKDLAKLIKDSWKSGDFTELGAMVGNKLNEALERIPWGKIQNTCNKIASPYEYKNYE